MITDTYNFPINCSGVIVFPGDVIVADGDGVIVVPREHALRSGDWLARSMREGRGGQWYERLGIPKDETVPQDN